MIIYLQKLLPLQTCKFAELCTSFLFIFDKRFLLFIWKDILSIRRFVIVLNPVGRFYGGGGDIIILNSFALSQWNV
jgi:hypothetical protein